MLSHRYSCYNILTVVIDEGFEKVVECVFETLVSLNSGVKRRGPLDIR